MNFHMEDFVEAAYSVTTKKLLICLKNFDRDKLEALEPNVDALVNILSIEVTFSTFQLFNG